MPFIHVLPSLSLGIPSPSLGYGCTFLHFWPRVEAIPHITNMSLETKEEKELNGGQIVPPAARDGDDDDVTTNMEPAPAPGDEVKTAIDSKNTPPQDEVVYPTGLKLAFLIGSIFISMFLLSLVRLLSPPFPTA